MHSFALALGTIAHLVATVKARLVACTVAGTVAMSCGAKIPDATKSQSQVANAVQHY